MSSIKKLLVIGFVYPEPKSSAAGNRMLQLIQLFKDFGYQITFSTTAQNIEFSENLIDLGIQSVAIELNSNSFDVFVKNLNPNIVLFDRFMIEEQFGWRVSENCPNAIKILDTEDFHSLRQQRQKAVNEKYDLTVADLLKNETAKREIASIYRCDMSLFVSEFEIDLLVNTFGVPEKLLLYLPIFANKIVSESLDFEQRNDFVFIGNFLHPPNWDCVKYLSETIWDKIHKRLPNAKMQVYGAYMSQKVVQLNQPTKHFFINGRANNAFEVIKNARVVLAPLRFGAGIKGKLLEAMQCGTPSVTTSIGAEGMFGNLPWNGYVADDIDDFVEKAIQLYENKKVWAISQENGYAILKSRYDRSIFEGDFKLKIAHLIENLNLFRDQNYVGALLQSQLLLSTKFMSKWIEEKNKKSSL